MLTFSARFLSVGDTSSSAKQGSRMTAVAPARAAGRERAHLERWDEWREELGTAFNRLVPEPLDGRLPDGHLDGGGLGELAAFTVTGSPQVVRRTAGAVRGRPAELLKICLQVRGRATVHQDGAEVVVEPGQMAMYDTGRPYDLRLEGAWVCAVLAFPGSALGLPRKAVDAARMRPMSVAAGPGAVLAGFVTSSVAQLATIGSGSAERLGEAGLHLVAGALSGAVPADGAAAIADAARLRVLAYVRAHLADPDLSHAAVAAAHHMAPRTLTRLFEHEPATVSEYIRSRRLHAVRRDLGDPLLAGRSIAAVAARWCFTDQANLTRAFRAEFGLTPSEFRRQSTSTWRN
jgi:AraC-like DNA-binding protein